MQVRISCYRFLAVALTPFSFIFPAYAQTGSAPAKAADSSVAEVSLDLVAHDKKGAPVRDLKPSDFEIAAGGAPVRIDDLHIVTAGPGPGQTQLVTLLFDHAVPGFARTARNVAAELLRTAPPEGILFAVLKVDGRLRLRQEFTADRDALIKAIDAATVDYKLDNDAAEKQMAADLKAGQGKSDQALSKVLLAMMLDSQDLARDPHRTPSIAALIATCRQQRVLPGRKTLVYFSAGLDWDIADPEMLGEVTEVAVRSRVSVYSVDAEILDPRTTSATLAAQSVNRTLALGGIGKLLGTNAVDTGITEQFGRIQSDTENAKGSRLAVICEATGGEHMNDSDNAHKSAQKIVDGVLSSYRAYFAAPREQGSDRFRTIRIKTLRAGISVETPGAYFALPRGISLAAPPFAGKLLDALARPELPSELQFRSSVLRFGTTPSGGVNSVAIEVPLSQVGSRASVLAQVRDQAGAIVQRFSEDIPAQGDTVSFRRHFIAAPGEYVLETAAMDASGSKIGAQRTKFKIPPVADGPALGDIVLVRQIEPAGGAADASEPLRCTEGKVVPNLSARLSRDTNPAILLFFDVLPDGRSPEKPALKLEVRRDGNLLGTVPLNLHPDAAKGPLRELAKIGTKSLRAGSYELTVVLSQGAQTAEQKVSVTLE